MVDYEIVHAIDSKEILAIYTVTYSHVIITRQAGINFVILKLQCLYEPQTNFHICLIKVPMTRKFLLHNEKEYLKL